MSLILLTPADPPSCVGSPCAGLGAIAESGDGMLTDLSTTGVFAGLLVGLSWGAIPPSGEVDVLIGVLGG